MLADSIIRLTLSNKYRLSRNQYNNLILALNSHLAKIDSLHKLYDEKLLRDSLRLNTEREILEGQTKTMIELHLNKIEHEYSNITMWGAVLTILFLVFSFYSIYKMDELIQQGNEGVQEIKNLRKEGKQDLNQLEKEKKEIVNNIQGQLKESVTAMSNTQKETERQFQDAVGNLNSAKDGLITESRGMLEYYKKQFDSILKMNNDNLEQKQQEFNDLITRLYEIFNKFDSKKED